MGFVAWGASAMQNARQRRFPRLAKQVNDAVLWKQRYEALRHSFDAWASNGRAPHPGTRAYSFAMKRPRTYDFQQEWRREEMRCLFVAFLDLAIFSKQLTTASDCDCESVWTADSTHYDVEDYEDEDYEDLSWEEYCEEDYDDEDYEDTYQRPRKPWGFEVDPKLVKVHRRRNRGRLTRGCDCNR